MFGKLKEKLKKTLEKLKEKVENEEEEKVEAPKVEDKKKVERKKKEAEKKKKETKEQKKEEKKEEVKKESKGILAKVKEKISKKRIKEQDIEEFLEELEILLLENNVALEVAVKIIEDLKERVVDREVEKGKVEEFIKLQLIEVLREIMDFDVEPLEEIIKNEKEKPYVIVFLGVNGSGKTTTIAKIAHLLMKKGMKGVIAASDTFRAGSIEQLEEHAKNVGIKVIKHDYKSDPAAVAFDAVKHAKAKGLDFVLIDTAGRLHSNKNLMGELKKIDRVVKPNMKIFVGESIVGNDSIEQAETFDKEVGIDAIILTKADVDEKGGTMISISFVVNKPILYLGTGQGYGDLELFDKEKIIKALGLV